jgi:hypothetical protein
MAFQVFGGIVRGLARFTRRTPDKNFELSPLTGAGAEGAFLATMYTSFEERVSIISLSSASVRTNADSISGTVVWSEDFVGNISGSFSGRRRK